MLWAPLMWLQLLRASPKALPFLLGLSRKQRDEGTAALPSCSPCSGTFTSHRVGRGWECLIRQGVHNTRCLTGCAPSQLSLFRFPRFSDFLISPDPWVFSSSVLQHPTKGYKESVTFYYHGIFVPSLPKCKSEWCRI